MAWLGRRRQYGPTMCKIRAAEFIVCWPPGVPSRQWGLVVPGGVLSSEDRSINLWNHQEPRQHTSINTIRLGTFRDNIKREEGNPRSNHSEIGQKAQQKGVRIGQVRYGWISPSDVRFFFQRRSSRQREPRCTSHSDARCLSGTGSTAIESRGYLAAVILC